MDQGERLISLDALTQADKVGQTDGIIEFVGGGAATTAHGDHRQAQFTGVHRGDESAVGRVDGAHDGGFGQVGVVALHEVGRTTEAGHHAPEDLGCLAIVQHRLQLGAGIAVIAGKTGGDQHLGAQGHGHFVDARVAILTGQVAHRFAHFHGVAGAGGQHLVHVGQECRGAAAGPVGHGDDALGQFLGGFKGRHEGAGAHLHVHHQGFQPGGELLGEDGAGDHGNGLDGGGDIPYRIDTLVRRGEIAGLADDGDTRLFHHFQEAVVVYRGLVAGNGIQLVQGTAGVAETSAGNHGHETAARSDHGAQHQGDDVTHTAGGVLVDDGAAQVEVVPGQHHAGVAHGAGQGNPLIHGHVLEVDRHGQGRDLPLADGVVGNALDEELNLLGTERFTVALLANNFLRQKHLSFPPCITHEHRPKQIRKGAAHRPLPPLSNRWYWQACRHAPGSPAGWPADWRHRNGRCGRIPSPCPGSLRPWPDTDPPRRRLSRHQPA